MKATHTNVLLSFVVLLCSIQMLRSQDKAEHFSQSAFSIESYFQQPILRDRLLQCFTTSISIDSASAPKRGGLTDDSVRVAESIADSAEFFRETRGAGISKDTMVFCAVGPTLGFPNALALRGSVHSHGLTFHLTLTPLIIYLGWQANLGLCLSSRENTQHYISALYGYLRHKPFNMDPDGHGESARTYAYYGISYILHTGDFLFEFGIPYYSGFETGMKVNLQFAYLIRL